MAANLDRILASEVDDRVSLFEPILIPRRTQLQPFELALRHDHLAIRDDGIAIGRIGGQCVGPHRRAIGNQILKAGRLIRRCRKSGHAGHFACAENGQCRGRCRASEKIAAGFRLYRHSFTLEGRPSRPFANETTTQLQYPVQRDALQQPMHLMVTAALGINQLSSAIDVMASSGTDLAVQPSDEVRTSKCA